jgi:glutamyl-tRNA reductase
VIAVRPSAETLRSADGPCGSLVAAGLSTCNRTELYAIAAAPGAMREAFRLVRLDLAMPRDVEPSVAGPDGVVVFAEVAHCPDRARGARLARAA